MTSAHTSISTFISTSNSCGGTGGPLSQAEMPVFIKASAFARYLQKKTCHHESRGKIGIIIGLYFWHMWHMAGLLVFIVVAAFFVRVAVREDSWSNFRRINHGSRR